MQKIQEHSEPCRLSYPLQLLLPHNIVSGHKKRDSLSDGFVCFEKPHSVYVFILLIS